MNTCWTLIEKTTHKQTLNSLQILLPKENVENDMIRICKITQGEFVTSV